MSAEKTLSAATPARPSTGREKDAETSTVARRSLFAAAPRGAAAKNLLRPALLFLLAAAGLAGGFLLLRPVKKTGVPTAGSIPAADGIRCVGRRGLRAGEFNQPRGIAPAPDGSWFVVDRSSRIQKFSARDEPLLLWAMPEHVRGNPKDLAVLPDGNLLICDTHYARVLKTTPAGKVLARWGRGGPEPGNFQGPLGCAVDEAAGVVYFADFEPGGEGARILKFTVKGRFLKEWGRYGEKPGEFRRPCGVAVAPDGTVYVADSVNHRVQHFTAAGKLLGLFGRFGDKPGELRYPFDVACDTAGRVYVAEYNGHCVSIFDKEGKFLRRLGAPGRKKPGEFMQPWSLAINRRRGLLYVSDTGNNRVQIFTLSKIFTP